MSLNRSAIAGLIPHAGPMCLLDEVTRWDERSIRAASRTHLDADNPLRGAGGIPTLSAVEYAAQAMAAHGALSGSIGGRPRAGYLVSLRSVACSTASLEGLAGDLTVDAEYEAGDAERVMYAFRVAVGERVVLAGKATVVLDAAAAER